ncbi:MULTISPECIES: hypothetical protein [Streptomyces]|uniref:Uncharacterized protein n=2 Tax=Streptomyces TaxID=1883 RepID=A0A4Q9HZR4_STRKA|nr:hypothetical protein [Streptomyces kasugaensis]TBO60595.1 hypothetical protein EYS09_05755 [Streptomyces kasugaensis]WSK12385.1 hypothetical protein OG717_11685 [Streptomyces celluloflavus]
MPTSSLEEADDLLEAVEVPGAARRPAAALRHPRPVDGPASGCRGGEGSALRCPSCGSPHIAQMLGDNGDISFVCTACGHSWS